MNIEIKTYASEIDEQTLADLDYLHKIIFDKAGTENFDQLKEFPNPLTLVAYADGKAAAFKSGFERDDTRFYSWMGGCDPKFRGLGLATRLMEEQHRLCKQKGYRIIETKSMPKWGNMLRLNDKFGFKIVKEYQSQKHGGTKYQLEKVL